MYTDSTDRGHATDSFLTFALGALAGATVALMFAPSTGRDMRARLAEGGRRAAEKGREFVNEQGAAVSDVVERGKDTVTQFADRVGQAVEQGKAGYRDAMQRGREIVSDLDRTSAASGD